MGRLLVCALIATAAACGGQAETPAVQTPQVLALGPDDVAVARTGEISSGVILTGTLEPADTVQMKAQVAGTIRNLRIDRGDAVRRGQVLATIEARAVQSEAAGASVAVSAAEANLATAARQLEGARTLHDAGAMSDVDFQAVQSQHKAAQAQVASARAQLSAATEQAARTTVVAPLTGVVSERKVNDGEAVSANQELLTVVNADTLRLQGQISVRQAARVRSGQPVTFTLDAYPGQEFSGRVARIDPVADPTTRQVGAALELPNKGHQLIAGQFVTGRVVTANVGKALQVPQTAIRNDAGTPADTPKPYVLVVENGTAHRRDVTTGTTDSTSGMVAIMSGLREGEVVVASPSADIQDGASVKLPSTIAALHGGETRQ